MRWITEDATLLCDHGGRVSTTTTQDFVRIHGRRVMIEPNPEARGISGCPNSNPLVGILSCRHTLDVREGYSTLVRIAAKPVCLDTILGYTDGSPPRVASYRVANPAQTFVEAST